ncbi:MAG: hypothetical protein CSA54_04900, partial [Gammaproteobacteria bacterium]
MNMLLILLTLFMSVALVGHVLLSRGQEVVRDVSSSVAERTDDRLRDLYIFANTRQLLMLYVAAVVLVPPVLFTFGFGLPLAVMAALVLLILPRLAIHRLAARRRDRINEALPDALAQIAGSMRAGATFTSAVEALVEEQGGALGQELSLMLRELRVGIRLEEALDNLAERVQTEEVDLVVSASLISMEIGGNLAEILFRLSDTLRRKLEMEGKIRALTAQGVLQGHVITALPFLIILALYFFEPEATKPLFNGLLGWIWLAVIGVMQLAGALMIRKIMRI